MEVLGIDIGGSGIKGAVIDTASGTMLTERHRLPTPDDAGRKALLGALEELRDHFNWQGPVGCGFPGVVREGVILTAANLEDGLIGWPLADALQVLFKGAASVLNDADAAGLAEVGLGDESLRKGVVMVLTVGTGVGSALFNEGQLVPNTELGHLTLGAMRKPRQPAVTAEEWASNRARKQEDLTWEDWAPRMNRVLAQLHALFWPDCFILGGGAAKRASKFEEALESPVPVKIARWGNHAGIIGAAHATASAVK